MPKRSSKLRKQKDAQDLARSILDVVDPTAEPKPDKPAEENPAAVALRGVKGGKARLRSCRPLDEAQSHAKKRWQSNRPQS